MTKSVLIMAGGSGERFWPLSTKEKPKQLLSIFSDKPLITKTYERVLPLVGKDNIFVATNEIQVNALKECLPDVEDKNIIIEPMFKDTAAAIGYGSLIISKYINNPTIAVLASDHLIQDEEEFRKVLSLAYEEADKNHVVTLGIKPTYPETGYGYIEVNNNEINKVTKAVSFREKPNLDIATTYFESGNYLWNSGMFIFKFSTIKEEFKKHAYSHYEIINEMGKIVDSNEGVKTAVKLKPLFSRFEKKSIDFAVMEKSDNIYVIPSSFKWNDVGSYEAFDELFEKDNNGNVVLDSSIVSIDSKNNIIISKDTDIKLSLLGIHDKVIVANNSNVLVCEKNECQRIKELIRRL